MLRRRFLSMAILGGALVFAFSAQTSTSLASETTKPTLEIIMYSTKTCGYCVRARTWFSEQGVAWEERDIETSDVARAEWQALGAVGTPFFMVNGTRIQGFMQKELEVEIAKYR